MTTLRASHRPHRCQGTRHPCRDPARSPRPQDPPRTFCGWRLHPGAGPSSRSQRNTCLAPPNALTGYPASPKTFSPATASCWPMEPSNCAPCRHDGIAVRTEVVCGGPISDHKGINLPGVNVRLPSLTEKDLADLHFGLNAGVDLVALSFVRSAGDVKQLRDRLGQSSRRHRRQNRKARGVGEHRADSGSHRRRYGGARRSGRRTFARKSAARFKRRSSAGLAAKAASSSPPRRCWNP